MIAKSFKVCALNLPVDGTDVDMIHCFKEGTTCEAGTERLKRQLSVMEIAESDERNPFDHILNEDDVEDAAQSFHLIDEDSSEDEP